MKKNTQNKHKFIQTSFLEQHIAVIKMQDKQRKNMLSQSFVEALEQNIKRLSDNKQLKAIILAGLPSVFCAGADLETLQLLGKGKVDPVDIYLSKLVLDIPVPVIAAMEGHATGGGLALGMCSDIVIMAEESRYGCPFMNMGFTPGMGITKLMEHFMSPAIAHELMYTGIFKKGKELKDKINTNYILPKAEVMPKAEQLAMAIAEKPAKTLRVLKRCLAMSRRKLLEETLTIESMMHEVTFNQQDILQNIQKNYVI